MPDFYEVLGVPRSASAADIRQAYVRLAKERHPDKFRDPVEKGRAEAFFKDLTTAYNTLFNESSRSEYDRERGKPKFTDPADIAREAHEEALALLDEGGSSDEVLRLLRSAAHHQPGEARYHAALGRFLAKRTTFAREAVQSLEKASALEPRNPAYLADLALVFHKQGLSLRAQKAAEQAQKLAPRDAQIQKLVELVRKSGR